MIVAGTFSLAVGIIGVFVPILPTTPFLLLAAACFARSSERFYSWLLGNKWFGKYIKNYREGKGIPLRAKVSVISLLWIVILFTAFLVVPILLVQIILILVAIGVTVHVLSLKTLRK